VLPNEHKNCVTMIPGYFIKLPVPGCTQSSKQGGNDESTSDLSDRTEGLKGRVEIVREGRKRKIQIFAYENNHHAGFAPE
jgi:hypothetical protein